MRLQYDLILTIFILDTTKCIMCELHSENSIQKVFRKQITKKKATTSTEKYVYRPIEIVNNPEIARSSEEVDFFKDSRIRMSLLHFLENNHSRLWNLSIEHAIYEPMKLVYQIGGIPKLNALEGYFVGQRFVDHYESVLDKWITEDVLKMIKEDKERKRKNLLELLRRKKDQGGRVPYHLVEQYWAWELYHTERYHKRELVLRNNLHILFVQLEKMLHNFVFVQEAKREHVGIPVIPFHKMMDYMQTGEKYMQDTLKVMFLGNIDVLQ